MTEQVVPNLGTLRSEMGRLTRELLAMNGKFIAREEEVKARHAKGQYNFTGNLDTVLGNDILLKQYSAGAKTLATLVAGLAAVLQAELAWHTYRNSRGASNQIHISEGRATFAEGAAEGYAAGFRKGRQV